MTNAPHIPGCTGKKRYDTRHTAKLAAESARRRLGKRMHVYECMAGPHWHMSSHAIPRAAGRQRQIESMKGAR